MGKPAHEKEPWEKKGARTENGDRCPIRRGKRAEEVTRYGVERSATLFPRCRPPHTRLRQKSGSGSSCPNGILDLILVPRHRHERHRIVKLQDRFSADQNRAVLAECPPAPPRRRGECKTLEFTPGFVFSCLFHSNVCKFAPRGSISAELVEISRDIRLNTWSLFRPHYSCCRCRLGVLPF